MNYVLSEFLNVLEVLEICSIQDYKVFKRKCWLSPSNGPVSKISSIPESTTQTIYILEYTGFVLKMHFRDFRVLIQTQ